MGGDGQRKTVPPDAGPYLKKLYVDDKRGLMKIVNDHEDLSYRKLRDYLKAEGVEFRPKTVRKKRLPATEQMVRDHARMGLMKTAAEHHVDPKVLRERLVLAGVEIAPRGRPAREQVPPSAKPKRKRKRGPRAPSHDKDPYRQSPPAATALTAAIAAKFEADVPVGQIAEWAGLSEEAVVARLTREGYEPDS